MLARAHRHRPPRPRLRRARLYVAGAVVLLASCRRYPPRDDGGAPAPSATPVIAPASAPSPTTRVGPSLITHREAFALADVQVSIEDVHMSTHLDELQRKTSAAVVINGGFFDPAGEPVGLAVSGGIPLSPPRPGLSGGVVWVRDGLAHQTASEEYGETQVDFAIQCRPRLVVGSRVNIRSDDGRRSERTVLCLRDGGRTLEVMIAKAVLEHPPPTLFELAEELRASGCEEALNLDGGPSTGWASPADGGTTFVSPRAPVRHAVVVRRR